MSCRAGSSGRGHARADSQALAQRMTEVTLAKELAIEQQRLDEAAALRDQERLSSRSPQPG